MLTTWTSILHTNLSGVYTSTLHTTFIFFNIKYLYNYAHIFALVGSTVGVTQSDLTVPASVVYSLADAWQTGAITIPTLPHEADPALGTNTKDPLNANLTKWCLAATVNSTFRDSDHYLGLGLDTSNLFKSYDCKIPFLIGQSERWRHIAKDFAITIDL